MPLNELELIRLVDELSEIQDCNTAAYGLTIARIMELSLFCAGNYADNCEFEAVGDLLVNPRRVNIYIRGKTNPVRKNRHGAISSQLTGMMGKNDSPDWLKHNTWPIIQKHALLPALYEELNRSGIIASDYLQSTLRRMIQIANTVAFLSAWQIDNATALWKKLDLSSPATRAFLSDNLCRFDLNVFHEIGQDIAGNGKGRIINPFLKKDIYI
jgi:hypothetical protein